MTWSKKENEVTASVFGEAIIITIIIIISRQHNWSKDVSNSPDIYKTTIKNGNANWFYFWHWLYFSQKILYFVHIIYKAYAGILEVSAFTLSHLIRLAFLFILYD